MRLLLLLYAFTGVLSADSYTIAGIVMQHGSNAPARRVPVFLSAVNNRMQSISVATGNEGQFSFTGLQAGKYALAVQSHGYVHAFHQNEGYSTAIAVGPNLDSEHIVFPLDGVAAVKGTVLDEEGDPVPNAQVLFFRRAVVAGRLQTTLLNQTNTNVEGEFRVTNLIPGTYLAAVQGRPWFAQQQPPTPDGKQNTANSQFDVVFPLTYYAGSINPLAVTPLILADGATEDLRITLHPIPAVHVQIENSTQRSFPQLFQQGPDGVEIPVYAVTTFVTSNQNGVINAPPGNYEMRIQDGNRHSTRLHVALTGDTTVDFSETQKPSVSGKLISPATPSPQRAVILLNIKTGEGFFGPAAEDGSFQMDAGPGRYELRLADAALYMKSVAVKGADYNRGELEVHDGSHIQLEITADKGFSNVTGTATRDGRPFPGAMILLVPQDFSHGAGIPRDQSDSDGTFTLASVPPGRYTLVAIEDGRGLAYHDAAVIAPYLKQGQAMEIAPSSDAESKIEVQRQIP